MTNREFGILLVLIAIAISAVAYPHLEDNYWRYAYLVEGMFLFRGFQLLGDKSDKKENRAQDDRK